MLYRRLPIDSNENRSQNISVIHRMKNKCVSDEIFNSTSSFFMIINFYSQGETLLDDDE